MSYFIYFLLLLSYISSTGFFSFKAVLGVFLTIVLLTVYIHKPRIYVQKIFSPQSALLILSLLSLIYYSGLYQNNLELIFLSYLLLSFNILLILKLIFFSKKRQQVNILIFCLAISVLIRLFMIWSSPNPFIDVFDILKLGAMGLMRGLNPYQMLYTKMYQGMVPDYYSYLPGMLYVTFPFVALLKDPRYAMLIFEIVISLLILKIKYKDENKYIYSLLFINNPISPYMIEQSYTDIIILFLFVLLFYFYLKKNQKFMVITLGFLLCTKQYTLLIIPLFYRLLGQYGDKFKMLFKSITLTFFLMIPFLLWSINDFMRDILWFYMSAPTRYDSLSFFALTSKFGYGYNYIISGLIIGAYLAYIYTRKNINLSKMAYLSSLTYLVFFFFNKYFHINYYYLISQLFLLGVILENTNDKVTI